jgi:hypothetical protein
MISFADLLEHKSVDIIHQLGNTVNKPSTLFVARRALCYNVRGGEASHAF